jgi:phosphate/sulfate permease
MKKTWSALSNVKGRRMLSTSPESRVTGLSFFEGATGERLVLLQRASAEVVAACTIGLADFGGMPVSTTHVLSSGVAGTMAVARVGLQYHTLYKIATAWVLTMPAAMLLSGKFFVVFSRCFA